MRKGFMYIDEEITLDFPMTQWLKESTDNLNIAFETNDYDLWLTEWDIVGVIAKTDHACGYITSEQMHKVWERYGTAG